MAGIAAARTRRRTERVRRDAALHELAAEQGSVVSRGQLYALGYSRGEVRAQFRARRWQRVWSRSVCLHTGPVQPPGLWWAAVFEGGRRARLDGASALLAAGLQGYEAPTIRVSVPRGCLAVRGRGLDVRRTRRWREDDLAGSGVPRTRPAVAAVHGALWAGYDRQAALLLTMTVQQGLATAEQVGEALLRVRRDRRRALLHAVVLDLLDGVRSLGELDFARECRARGLPAPTRQVLRRGRRGGYHLDVVWEAHGVVVEIDGIQHGWVQNAVADAIRHNDVALEGATVLRLPVLGLRIAPDEFFEQIGRALARAEAA